MKFINLTPHDINFYRQLGGKDHLIASFPPSGTVARCTTHRTTLDEVDLDLVPDTIPVNRVVFGEIEGLPDPAPGVGYIVSAVIANALMAAGVQRSDVFTVDDAVRDNAGRVIGCRALAYTHLTGR